MTEGRDMLQQHRKETDRKALRRVLERERIDRLRQADEALQRYAQEGRNAPERDDGARYRP